jgi:signal transduction histidine kinase/HAMP domain-containing protein
MKSIKTKIITAFLVVIVMMITIVISVIIINYNLLNKYQQINENIIYEQELKDNIFLLIEESYQGFNTGDYSKYNSRIEKIRNAEEKLDINFSQINVDQETKLAYRSIKNSLNSVVNGIEKIKNNNSSILGISTLFQDSIEKFEFVKQNVSNLLVLETKNIAKITQDINEQQTSIIFFIGIVTFLIILLLIIFSLIFSKKITNPIINLSEIARKISEGNLSLSIDKDLLDNKDELGSLAKSFNLMIIKLREKIVAFEDSNRELDLKVKEITDNNLELENNKTVIINLLEDFNQEKSNAENLVVIRTKELSDEKARLLASINSLKMGFAIVGMDGNLIISNPSLANIFDIKENFVSLDDISKYLNIKDESLFERLKKCTKDKCIIKINEIMFGVKYLRLFLNPVFSLDGIPIGGVLLIEDITEEKVLERSKDEFFAVASHELRTPLTAIRSNTEMILEDYKDKIEDKNVKEMLMDIDEASIRLIGIVNDFLEVSRLEQGNILFEKIRFNLLELVEKVVNSLQAEANKKNLLLEVIKPENSLPEVFADRAKINQILFNLLGNSLKFTDKGSIKITFEIIGGNIKVRITDTGKGISAKNENLLFRKFQPAGDDVLARDVTQSTGLGLYISKILIDKMGGTIGLEKTEAGVGSTFFFTVPIIL